MSLSRLLVSALILVVMGLHLGADAARAIHFSQWLGSRSWPVQAYGMYRNSSSDPVIRTTKRRLIGMTARGGDLEIQPRVSGLESQALFFHFVDPMQEEVQSVADRLADRINIGRLDPVVAFRIEEESVEISDSGLVREILPPVTYTVDN